MPSGRAVGRVGDAVYRSATALAAMVGVVAIAYLIVRTAVLTAELLGEVGVRDFVTGREWIPSTGAFGALPAIMGTLATSLVAMVLAVPLALGAAIGTSVLLPPRIRGLAAGLIDLLAAIPSVVYGLWGFLVLVPAVRPVLEWVSTHSGGIGILAGPVLGGSVMLAGVVLAVMVLPIITAVIREVIDTVPHEQREAALALGATRWEMIRSAILPAARSGIVGASALGLGRAVGETIAVAMVIGGQASVFSSLFQSGQTLAGTIANEYNSAVSSLHTSAMVSMALMLFLVAFVVNLGARAVVGRATERSTRRILRRRRPRHESRPRPTRRSARPRSRRGRAAGWTPRTFRWVRVSLDGGGSRSPVTQDPSATVTVSFARVAVPVGPLARVRPAARRARRRHSGRDARAPLRIGRARRIRSRVAEGLVLGAVGVALVPLVMVIGYCVVRGAGAIGWDFLTSDGEPDLAGNGVKHALTGTLIMVGVATAVAAPLGVMTALFLRDCAVRGPFARRAGAALGVYVDMLLGVPSIVAGLVVSVALVQAMGTFSAFAGGLALAMIMYPIVVRSADEMLRLVPGAQVEAALALGAPRWRTAWSVSLPVAAPGIVTGVLLGVARVAGETAPLLLTALGAQFFSTALFAPIASLPQYIFTGTINSTVPVAQEHSWGAALVLVALVLVINLGARAIVRRAPRETR